MARAEAFSRRESLITETVFSHRSKLDMVAGAVQAGYLVELHVMLVPENLAVARVAYRIADGGHTVPEDKVRQRYRRLWELIAQARKIAHRARFYDNSRSPAFSPVASYELGRPVGKPAWPVWTPDALTTAP